MKIFCTGATGRVGKLLVEKYGVIPLQCDITDYASVEKAITTDRPDIIAHLAGISNVDYCEKPDKWGEVVATNYGGTQKLVSCANEHKVGVMFLSSDHVYSGRTVLGTGGGPYRETDRLTKNVANGYGLSKLAAEGLRIPYNNMKIIRTSYLFDFPRLKEELESSASFPTFIRRSYMFLPHFVDSLYLYLQSFMKMPRILHISGTDTVSQYQFMSEFSKEVLHKDTKVEKRTHELKGFAPRPHSCGLNVSLSAQLGFPQYSYKDGFKDMVNG